MQSHSKSQCHCFLNLLLLFNYICPHFPPLLSSALPTPSHTQSSPHTVLVPRYFINVPYLDPSPSFPSYPPTLWSLSVCSLFPCLWFCFAYLFVLLIRFHLNMRSYGICLPLPGLFHLTSCSPVPSML